MQVLIGLGNSPEEYANTRHNTGFMAIDYLAEKHNINLVFDPDTDCMIGANDGLILVKPYGFINESGKPVKEFLRKFSLEPRQIVAIHDAADVPVGRFGTRNGGSSEGHKGVKDIIDKIGPEFRRFRIGIDRKDNMIDHVLGEFTPEEKSKINNIFVELDRNRIFLDADEDVSDTGMRSIW